MNYLEHKLNNSKQGVYHAADHSAEPVRELAADEQRPTLSRRNEIDPFEHVEDIKNDLRDVAAKGKQDLGRIASKSLNAAVQTAEQYRQKAISSAQKKLGEMDALSRDGLGKVQIAADNRLREVGVTHQGGHSHMKKEFNARIASLKSAVNDLDKSSGKSKGRRKKSHK